MKKLFALLIVATSLFSCDKTESPIFDGARKITYFQQASASLQVVLNEGGSVSRNIVSSEISNVDRTVQVVLDTATISNPDAFSFTQEVVIPAGEYTGVFTVEGFSVEELTTDNELLVFSIASTSDGSDLNGNLQQLEIQMRLICPVPDDFFTGTYTMEQISTQENPFFANFGRSLGTQTVEVAVDEDVSTQRVMQISYFPGSFDSPYQLEIDLSCGEFVPRGFITTGALGCSGGASSIGITAPDVLSNFVIEEGDDVLIVDVLDFGEDGGCGTTPYVATLQFTKQ